MNLGEYIGYLILHSGERNDIHSHCLLDGNILKHIYWDIKKLVIESPKVKYIWCYGNDMEEIELCEGVETIDCYDNKLDSITLPKSISYISCDKHTKLIGDLESIEIDMS